MRTFLLLLSILAMILGTMDPAFAAKRASRQKMINRCYTKLEQCQKECDYAPNTTEAEYNACYNKCYKTYMSCRRNVDIAYPAREGDGGDGSPITFGTEGNDAGAGDSGHSGFQHDTSNQGNAGTDGNDGSSGPNKGDVMSTPNPTIYQPPPTIY